ncbi:fumarylacetoacetate hydrolase domain-containing protein 2-like [Argonauta hians]
MKFVQFERILKGGGTKPALGVEIQHNNTTMIADLNLADSTIPTDMKTFLQDSHKNLIKTLKAVEDCECYLEKKDVNLLSPITQPDKLICVGMNYKDHCEELEVGYPEEPVIFSKFSSCIVGPHGPVLYPKVTTQLDWEVELAVVIGKGGKDIPVSEAMSCVFGYTVAFDVSARDWQLQRNGQQWLLGKTMDTFCPLGPCIVMKEDITDIGNLGVRCRVNSVTKQDSSTSMLVHTVDKLVHFISRFVTLLPGDVILTGTPGGVGVFRKPPEFLKQGDEVICEIDGIGAIQTKII